MNRRRSVDLKARKATLRRIRYRCAMRSVQQAIIRNIVDYVFTPNPLLQRLASPGAKIDGGTKIVSPVTYWPVT